MLLPLCACRGCATPARVNALCAQDARCSSGVPFSAGGRRSIRPAGARARRARVRRQRMDALSANPGRRSRIRRAGCPEGGAVGVPFLLVPFLWASKEKEPARRDAGRTCTDAGRSSRRGRSFRTRKGHGKSALTLPSPASGRGEALERSTRTQRTTFPSESMTLTSPSLSARTPASIFARSPTTIQVSASGRTISFAAACTAGSVCASMRPLSVCT